MIMKFAQAIRLDEDGRIQVTSEQVVDSEEEAEQAGREFFRYFQAFILGYGKEGEGK